MAAGQTGRGVIRLDRVVDAFPVGFPALQAEARAPGRRMLDTLAAGWGSGATRFGRPQEALLAAVVGDALAGIGGLTLEPSIPGAMRMRRFYVTTALRRIGVGHTLVSRLLEESVAYVVTANAARGSEPFWEAFGFQPEHGATYTHILVRDRRPQNLPSAAGRSG